MTKHSVSFLAFLCIHSNTDISKRSVRLIDRQTFWHLVHRVTWVEEPLRKVLLDLLLQSLVFHACWRRKSDPAGADAAFYWSGDKASQKWNSWQLEGLVLKQFLQWSCNRWLTSCGRNDDTKNNMHNAENASSYHFLSLFLLLRLKHFLWCCSFKAAFE